MIFNHEEHEEHEDIQSPKSAIIKKSSNRNGALEFDETDSCEQGSDRDGLADGKEDTNRNGARDPGQQIPLDDDTDDGVKDRFERKIETPPGTGLSALRRPHRGIRGNMRRLRTDENNPLPLTSQETPVNYLKIRNIAVNESSVEISAIP